MEIKFGIKCQICGKTIELCHPDEKRFPICDECLQILRNMIFEYRMLQQHGWR